MPSTIFTAPQYDPRRERRKRLIVVSVLVALVVLGALAYLYRNWPEERVVDHFFTALVNKDFERAYGVWIHDPQWKQHPEKYPNYSFREFYNDWGPGGEWGIVKSFRIEGSANPKAGSGVVVVVTVNERKEPARIWVEKKDKTLTFSPY
ncbi:MAG: hypothetical protein ACR2IF_10990 [Terriglobales bacterium]